jgi:hypothetical protein
MGVMAAVHQTAIAAICRSLRLARRFEQPYRHFYADDLLPRALVEALALLPLEPQDAAHFTGKREDENATRFYIDAPLMRRFPPLAGLAEALQSGQVAAEISTLCGADLDGAHLRLEYALDRDGFWLEPHTDLGEKKLTSLISLAEGEAQADLGTDIYEADKSLSKRAPFRRNGALIFVPGPATWHGFERRPIPGLRRSLILNYVGPQWRDREQLAFPDRPIRLDG